MKNRIRRYSKASFSVLLALCLFVSCLTVGVIPTDAANIGEGVGLNVQGSVYVDLSGASNWGDNVSYIVGKSGYSTSYNMTRLTGTSIYYKNIGSDWSDATEFAFHNGSWGDKSDKSESISARWSGTKHTAINNSYGMNSGSTYLATITGSSNDYGLSIDCYSNGYSDFNKQLTIKTMLYNGSTYADSTSTKCGTFSASGAYRITGDSATTAQSVSQTNGTGTITTARTNSATISQSPVSGFKFMGWKDSSDSTGSGLSGGNYTFTNAGSDKTIYAYYKRVYTVTFSQPENGTITYNSATTSPITVEHGSNVSLVITPNTDYRIKSLTDGSAVAAAVGKTTAYTHTISAISANHTVTAVLELDRTALDAPSIKMANSTSNQTVNAKRGEKISLSWSSITNAVSYDIYKDDEFVTNVSTTSYAIEKGYSYSGTYKVIAKPAVGDPTYTFSAGSNEITLTVNKVQLAAPTVTQSATEVEAGETVTFTITDTNSTNYVQGTDYKYQRSGENNTTYTDSPTLTWTTGALNTGGTRTFTFRTLSLKDDYYTSNTVEKTVYVSKAKFYLTGDLVTGTGGEEGWPTNCTDYPINTYVSKDIFYTFVTVNTGGNNDNHYFRLTDLSAQYKNGTTDIDMANHDSAESEVTLSDTGTQGALYVTGKGTFMIYVDQSETSPKVWVVNDKWLLTAKAYYQTYNLDTDTYNTAAEGTTGGTVSPIGDNLVDKGSGTTYTATAASGYTFDGWYTSTAFDAEHKASGVTPWSFVPSDSVDYYALFKQNEPARRTIYVDAKDHITVKATYNGTEHAEGTSFNVPHGAKVTVSYTLDTGCELVGTPSPALDGNNQFTATANTHVIVNAKLIDYTLTAVITPAYGTLKFYSDSTYSTEIQTANYNQTIFVKYESPSNENYEVDHFTVGGTSNSVVLPTGVYDRGSLLIGTANVTVTAHVQLQYSVKYYVDMHANSMTGKTLQIAIVDGESEDTLTDAHGRTCSSTLSHEGTGNVYSASIPTPLNKTGSNYNSLFIKITYDGHSYTRSLATNQVAALAESNEMWLEGVNESSQPTKLTYATNSGATPFVADNMRRIYLAKPHSWGNGSDKWENIGVYYWGETATDASITWTQGIHMTYLGYDEATDDGYYYYYVDIPKPASGGTSNIIFQGWGSNTSISSNTDIKAQTGNIENLPLSQNFLELVYDNPGYSAKKLTAAIMPSYTRYVSSVKMNVSATETPNTANIAPTYTGGGIRYTSSDTSKVTVSDSGVITAVASTVNSSGVDVPVTITVSVLGTVGALIPNENVTTLSEARDAVTYTFTVSVHNPAIFNGFNIMALATQSYTVAIPIPDGYSNQPGYFDFENCVVTVTGIQGAESSVSSAIITTDQNSMVTVDGVQKVKSFTVKYAKADPSLNLMRDAENKYENIVLTAVIVTKSIHAQQAARFGFDHWEVDGTTTTFRTTQVIGTEDELGIETATTEDLVFVPANSAYNAIFKQYEYVDVTFTYQYPEYVPKVVDGFTEYPYDATWALEPEAHKTTTYTVYSYEVRDQNADSINGTSLRNEALKAIADMPVNNYYDYSITASGITVTSATTATFSAEVTVVMSKSLKHYSVYLNGSQLGDNYTYQEKVTAPASGTYSSDTGWYAVDDENIDAPGANDPLLSIGSTYTFRVKGDTYLRTVGSTTLAENEFNRSENDFSHYEISHRDDNKEYLLQNFYIADFFDPSKVKRGDTPEDDVTFVGGGVVYYSIKNGEPNSNAVDMGYVSPEGVMDAGSVKAMLKSAIEKEYYDHDGVDDPAGAVNRLSELGTDDAMKVAYGTEIPAQQYIDPDNNIKTGMVIRYLPMEAFNRENGDIVRGADGYTMETTTNSNVFRYSNSLNSYQYIYANGNENKLTNNGRNMRLYSYYIYSYTDYDLETNVPSTKYVIVMSDNYSDASTYWSNPAATTNN